MDHRLVRELVVPRRCLDELALKVEDAALADLVDDLEVWVLGLSLERGGAVDVGLAAAGVLVLEVEPGDLEVRLQFVVDGVLFLTCGVKM